MSLLQKHRGKTIAALLLLLLALGLMLFFWKQSQADKRPKGQPPATPVQLLTLVPQDVSVYLSGIGNVQALQSVTLRAQLDGVLQSLHFQEGELVKQGQLLARIDDRAIRASLQQAQAQQASNQALLRAAEADLQRFENLAKVDVIAKQAVDQQRAQVEQLQAALQANAASIAASQVQLSYTEIRSPLSGRAGLRRVDVGNLLRASDANGIVTISQVDPIAVVFTLPQDALPQLRRLRTQGQPVKVQAFDRQGAAPLAQGRLLTLDNQVDSQTGTLRLKAQFANSEDQLWPGQFVSLRLEGERHEQVLALPLRALQRGPEQTFVYRLQADGETVEAVPVRLGLQTESLAIIEAGLHAGDQVVVDGQSRLKPGARVVVAAATQAGS